MVEARPAGTIGNGELIILAALLMALNAMSIDIMLPALPQMGEALGVTFENDRQLVLSMFLLGFGAAQIIYGPLSDHFGRKAPMLIAVAIYFVAVVAALLAPNFATLIALRIVQGIGAAGTRVIAQAVVRDRFSGTALAEAMSLLMVVFMILPVISPGMGQVLLLTGNWSAIFIFMAAMAGIAALWTFFRLPETLDPAQKRPLEVLPILAGFGIVLGNRQAIGYTLANLFRFAALFGLVNSAQQIYVDTYGLGPLFPVAFAATAGTMGLAALTNSQVVRRFGIRRIGHGAALAILLLSALWYAASLFLPVPLWLFMGFLLPMMFLYGLSAPNMNALAMQPLGHVAGTAASTFGFIQTVGAALIGLMIGRFYDGSIVPVTAGYLLMAILALIAVLFAERGKLFEADPVKG